METLDNGDTEMMDILLNRMLVILKISSCFCITKAVKGFPKDVITAESLPQDNTEIFFDTCNGLKRFCFPLISIRPLDLTSCKPRYNVLHGNDIDPHALRFNPCTPSTYTRSNPPKI